MIEEMKKEYMVFAWMTRGMKQRAHDTRVKEWKLIWKAREESKLLEVVNYYNDFQNVFGFKPQ